MLNRVKYLSIRTKHIMVAVVCSWLLGVGLFVLMLLLEVGLHELVIIQVVFITSSAVALTVCNIIIYITAKKHDRFVRQNGALPLVHVVKKPKMLKASRVCIVVVFSFVLLWLPFMVHDILHLIGRYQPADGKLFTMIVEHVGYSNSFIDAIVFVWLHKDTKKELKMLLFCKNTTTSGSVRQRKITKKITRETLFDFDMERGSPNSSSPLMFALRNFVPVKKEQGEEEKCEKIEGCF